MTFTPYPFQVRDVEILKKHNYTALLAIDPGGTKTAISCMAIKESGVETVLVVAPDSTHETAWRGTIKDICGVDPRIIGRRKAAEKKALADFEWGVPGVYLATPQFTTRYENVHDWTGDMLIVDECHQVTTGGGKAQRKFSGFTDEDNPLRLRFTHRLALSGTPMRQNFENMWGTMRLLWPELNGRKDIAYDNFFMWRKDRMTSELKYTSNRDEDGRVKRVTVFINEAEPGKLVSEMPCVIIHKKRERCCEFHPNGFLAELPEPQRIPIVVDLTPKQKKAIAELEKMSVTWLDGKPFVVDLPVTVKLRLRQLCLGEAVVETYEGVDSEGTPVDKTRLRFEDDCESPFLDATLDILENMDNEEPVIIYLESKRFAKVVLSRLRKAGITAGEYSGDEKADLTRFGKDYRVLVAIIPSLGTGTDGLQNVCNTEIYLETPISLTSQEQVQSRLDRLGNKQVQRYILLDKGGYAAGRYGALLEKQLAANASLTKG